MPVSRSFEWNELTKQFQKRTFHKTLPQADEQVLLNLLKEIQTKSGIIRPIWPFIFLGLALLICFIILVLIIVFEFSWLWFFILLIAAFLILIIALALVVFFYVVKDPAKAANSYMLKNQARHERELNPLGLEMYYKFGNSENYLRKC